VQILFALILVTLFGRAVDLQLRNSEFLKKEGDSRHLRVVSVPAHRGSIVDRNGEPLAVTTPVDSVWVSPVRLLEFEHVEQAVVQLAHLLGLNPAVLMNDLQQRAQREFWYLRRKIDPDLSQKVRELKIPGVHFQREYQRFYPDGEVTAQLIGVTDIDDRGQEGIELAYDHWLNGQAGRKRIIRDRNGHAVQDVENIEDPSPGQTLQLTIDRRIQYLAYRELKAAVARHGAKGGMVVVLDAESSEMLAIASQPGFNPNNRNDFNTERMRNRGLTDQFEPGSTMKPFTVAAALETGIVEPDARYDAWHS
jgi:cell division protein FtsI (penicillin-binding protein 3)